MKRTLLARVERLGRHGMHSLDDGVNAQIPGVCIDGRNGSTEITEIPDKRQVRNHEQSTPVPIETAGSSEQAGERVYLPNCNSKAAAI
jgi:hypothetical protein